MLSIREIKPDDYDEVWQIFSKIVKSGDTYAYHPTTSKEEALDNWVKKAAKTYVAVANNEVVGTYYIKPNQQGLGSHVCNCGYMVSEAARGSGIATKMCLHSQQQALSLGFLAMQFNLVVSSNTGAIRLWQKLGFNIVGTLPKAFNFQEKQYVDAMIMYKWLEDSGDFNDEKILNN